MFVSVKDASPGAQVCFLGQAKAGAVLPRRWAYGSPSDGYGLPNPCRPLEVGHTYLVEVTSGVGLGVRRFEVTRDDVVRPLDAACLDGIHRQTGRPIRL